MRCITIELDAKKGAAHRRLREAVERKRAAIAEGEEDLPAGMRRALEAVHTAANKLISAAGRGDVLHVGISVMETPDGGWDVCLSISDAHPTFEAAP